jgi:hemin uptake protein HemP
MRSDQSPTKSEGNQGRAPQLTASKERVASQQLLGRTGALIIEHEGREYRLRRTQSGKLILTA